MKGLVLCAGMWLILWACSGQNASVATVSIPAVPVSTDTVASSTEATSTAHIPDGCHFLADMYITVDTSTLDLSTEPIHTQAEIYISSGDVACEQ